MNIERMQVEQPYDADRDVAFFSGPGDFLTLDAGTFAIFAPHDVHMPCVAAGGSMLIRKIDEALRRIVDKEYGYCEKTGEPIGIQRLIARPTATLTIEAQERREMKQKMYGE